MGNQVSSPAEKNVQVIKRHLDKTTADVYFVCGEHGERIPAHKTVLSRKSDVFEATFFGETASETYQNLLEHSPEAFKDFLQFFYQLNEITLRFEYITEVIDLIKKYNTHEYLRICETFLIQSFTIEKCCLIYGWSIFYELNDLKNVCENQIRDHPRLVFETTGFVHCEHYILDHILQMDAIVCDESVIFEACLNWARNKCEQNGLYPNRMKNLRQYLKNSICKIRFDSLKMENIKKYPDIAELFEDSGDYDHINRLASGIKDVNNERFHLSPRFVAEWKEIPNARMFCTFAATGKVTLKGIYFAPVMRKASDFMKLFRSVPVINKIGTYIKRKNVSFKMVIFRRIDGKKTFNAFCEVIFNPNEDKECYVDLTAHDIKITPGFIYTIALKASDKCYSHFPLIGQSSWGYRSSCAWATQLDNDTRICFNGKSIIRSFNVKRSND